MLLNNEGVVDVLLLGPVSVGKSTFLKQLKTLPEGPIDISELVTLSTVGVDMAFVSLDGEVTSMSGNRRYHVSRRFIIREVGGCMAPVWSEHIHDACMLWYMIDLANAGQIACACMELCRILNDERLLCIPVLLICNKVDVPSSSSVGEIMSILRLHDLQRQRVRHLVSSRVGTVDKRSDKDKKKRRMSTSSDGSIDLESSIKSAWSGVTDLQVVPTCMLDGYGIDGIVRWSLEASEALTK